MTQIIFITGNMASGKSTVAQALAEHFPQSVHLRGDIFRRMIVNGQAEMSSVLTEQAQRQLQLRYDLAVTVAKRYVDEGFVVVYQDIVIGPALREVADQFSPYPLSIVVLCPRPDVIAARDRARSKTGYPDESSVNAFEHILRDETPRMGYWLDNSDLSVTATVDLILAHLKAKSTPE